MLPAVVCRPLPAPVITARQHGGNAASARDAGTVETRGRPITGWRSWHNATYAVSAHAALSVFSILRGAHGETCEAASGGDNGA